MKYVWMQSKVQQQQTYTRKTFAFITKKSDLTGCINLLNYWQSKGSAGVQTELSPWQAAHKERTLEVLLPPPQALQSLCNSQLPLCWLPKAARRGAPCAVWWRNTDLKSHQNQPVTWWQKATAPGPWGILLLVLALGWSLPHQLHFVKSPK